MAEALSKAVSERAKELLEGPEFDGEIYARYRAETDKQLIEAALVKYRGNQSQAAFALGINRGTLRKKITDLGLG